MVKAAGTKKKETKGKQRIEIKYIEDKEKRQVTFSKRKGGLLKKASELHLLCGARVALVVFSQAASPCPAAVAAAAARQAGGGGRRPSSTAKRSRGGNVFAMGTPSVDHVLRRLAVPIAGGADPYGHHRAGMEEEDGGVVAGREGAEATARRRDVARGLVDAEGKRMKAVEARVMEATTEGRFWWEADVAALGEADLPEFGGALKRLRDNVMRRHADKLVAQ